MGCNYFSSGDGARVAHPLFQAEDDGSIPISPLQLKIEIIGVDLARHLNGLWHSILPNITNPYSAHTICFGAEYKNRWYASAIWTSPIARVFNHKGYIELRRMAISEDAPKNTASRMLKIMGIMIKREFPNIWKLISYQDMDCHQGTIYRAQGWSTPCKETARDRSWNCPSRKRNEIRPFGKKLRWEKNIRDWPAANPAHSSATPSDPQVSGKHEQTTF